MNNIYLLTLLASTAALAYLVLWFVRKKKRLRTQLRLLRGRRHILSEEISLQMALIQAADNRYLDVISQRANDSLDALNVALVERQAHLLNYADLAHLQDYKIQLYEGDMNDSSTSPTPSCSDTNEKIVTAPPVRAPNDADSKEVAKNRSQIENQLLKKIEQINRKQ